MQCSDFTTVDVIIALHVNTNTGESYFSVHRYFTVPGYSVNTYPLRSAFKFLLPITLTDNFSSGQAEITDCISFSVHVINKVRLYKINEITDNTASLIWYRILDQMTSEKIQLKIDQ